MQGLGWVALYIVLVTVAIVCILTLTIQVLGGRDTVPPPATCGKGHRRSMHEGRAHAVYWYTHYHAGVLDYARGMGMIGLSSWEAIHAPQHALCGGSCIDW